LFLLVSLVLLLCMVGSASAVEVKVDFGAGSVVPEWTQWLPGGWGDPEAITIDGVDFTIVGPWDNWRTRIRGDYGDDLTSDCVGFEDSRSGSLTLTISNLPAGGYRVVSYHNSLFDHITPVVNQIVNGSPQGSGATPAGQNTESCLQLTATFEVTGPADIVTIDYSVIASMPFLSGFELVSTSTMLRFASTTSGDFESVSPAELEVVVLNADPCETYTVDYEVIDGTAVKDQDYTLTEPATLTFDPGQTSKTISIDITSDGLDEEDETIVVELSNVTGSGATLGGITQHTYTIRDPRPVVGFEAEASIASEDGGSVGIPVSLSFSAPNTVTVNYAVTDGTATGGGGDYTLAPGTLTFDPGEITEWIDVAVVDDDVNEANETIVITLSDIVAGKPGTIEHTLTLVDPTVLELKVDLAVESPWGSGIPLEATVKPGWIPWAAVGWGDLYMHDWRGIQNLGGTGIDASITGAREGTNGLKCYDMCMCNKGGGCPPTGSPVGGPIANTWYTSVDRVGYPQGSVLLALYNLPVGTFVLVSYHNLWEPCSDDQRECNKCGYSGPAMPKVHVWSFADANDYGQTMCLSYPQYCGQFYDALNKMKGFAAPGYGNNVVAQREAYDVLASHTTNDDEVTTSVVKFRTDGSPVVLMYEAADWLQTQYIGGRGVLNAFRLITFGEAALAFDPNPGDEEEDVHPEAVLQWQPGIEAALHDVYFGTDADAVGDANTAVTLGVYKGRQDACEYDPGVSLELGRTYYWRIDEVNDTNIWQGYVWSFTVDMGQAGNPSPFDGQTDVLLDATLSWSPGIVAASHDIYLGTSFSAVNDATTSSAQFKDNQALGNESYDPCDLLQLGQTCYWRIDEVNPSYATIKGDVWSFTVAECMMVDDMESYCMGGGCTNQIYDTWIDNWINLTGSIIVLGVDPEPVHAGSQSMNFYYNNDFMFAEVDYSETERAFADPCNWAGAGTGLLTLYFYGDPGNDATSAEQMYLGLEDDTGPASYIEVTYPNMADIQVAEWQQWDTELSDFNDGGVDLSAVKKIYIGFGDRDDPVAGGEVGCLNLLGWFRMCGPAQR
jgi:hypothetical protein